MRPTFCVLLLTFLVSSVAFAEPADVIVCKRVNAHMVIGDYQEACEEGRIALQQFPQSKSVWQAYIRALAKSGDEKAMMGYWNFFIERFPEEANNREILECLAWAVIEKGCCASSPVIRVTAMLGAFFSQDAKGVAILCRGLHDENSFLRRAAVKLASMLPDASLQDCVLHLFKTEKVWGVRLEAIKAVGKMEMESAKNGLAEIIAGDKSHAEEKAAAIQALVMMSKGVDREQLQRLVKSDRAGMRLLACEYVGYFEQLEDVDLLFPLYKDHHPEVRAKVFQTLGKLRVKTIAGNQVLALASQGIYDPDPFVAVTAAWLLTINEENEETAGMQAFSQLLNHSVRETRHLAAAALASTGKYGVALAAKVFQNHPDPYVRMNLSMGLIGQRQNTDAACKCLYDGLMQQKERWMWQEVASFRVLAPGKVKHDDSIPNYPEAVNQLTRLEVLRILSLLHYPKAQQAIKNFLHERRWEISGLASALLLTEGDDDAVDLVKQLVNESDAKIKIQAALILALWGKEEDVVTLLQQAYPTADRELKGQILEGIGRVGSTSSLQFLAQRLQEPYQTLRIIAAAALLECLYN